MSLSIRSKGGPFALSRLLQPPHLRTMPIEIDGAVRLGGCLCSNGIQKSENSTV
jgi:hypothetical protein